MLAIALSTVAAVTSVMCAAAGRGPVPAVPPQSPAAPPASALSPAGAPSASVSAAASTFSTPPSSATAPASLALPHFHAALRALERHEAGDTVRVLWFGDSHTAADFWTEAARKPLFQRFGSGGPGSVMIGIEKYRHEQVRVTTHGKWRHEPSTPSTSTHQLDGVFGLGGIRVVPESADARAAIELGPDVIRGDVRFTLYYRAAKGDELTLSIRGQKASMRATRTSGRAGPPGSPIRRVELVGKAGSTLDIAVKSGAPEVFGIAVDSVAPGVAIDTLGINGARVATALAWDEPSFEAEVADRKHALVVIAYGTNEAVSTLAPDRYGSEIGAFAKRLSQAAPNADCLVLGPPDMATPDGGSAPRILEFDAAARAAAAQSGCAFISAFSVMGGEGSFARWAKETPPLAWRDNVHLTSAGYERVGSAIAQQLLAGYDKLGH